MKPKSLSTYGQYSTEKYKLKWSTVNIRPETKALLKEIVEHLSSDVAVAPMATVVDNMVRTMHTEIFNK